MPSFNVILSNLKETASKERLSHYHKKQKSLDFPVYYLLPSVKWLSTGRKIQPGMAFKTFDDLAEVILREAGFSYVPVTETERNLFFQQLFSSSDAVENPHKAKAYAQTYGQLKRLGLTIDDLPKGLDNLKCDLEQYENEWVKKQRLLDPENRFHEALSVEGVTLPMGEIVIDGYMDFSPLQYAMIQCLMKNGVTTTVYIPYMENTEIIEDTIRHLTELGFSISKAAKESSTICTDIQVKKAVTLEEEILWVLEDISQAIKDDDSPSKLEDIGLILADGSDDYKLHLKKLAQEYCLPVKVPQKKLVVETVTFKIISLLLSQQSYMTKWEKVALIDQLYQLMFYPVETYWKSKQKFIEEHKLDEEIDIRLGKCINFARNFTKQAPLVSKINELTGFLTDLSMVDVWKQKLISEDNTKKTMKIRLEWEALEGIIALLESKQQILLEQGLDGLSIDSNIFSQWLKELIRKKDIYVERKPAVGIELYSFRDIALFSGKKLYVLGMNEGIFPSIHKLSGYFQESDLKELPIPYGVPSKATFRKKDEAMFKQLFYIAHSIDFSYVCGFDPENEYQPSPFIEGYLPNGLKPLTTEERFQREPITKKKAEEQTAFMMGLGRKVEGAPRKLIEMDQHNSHLLKGEEIISCDKSGTTTEMAITALEQYATCPFKFGLEKGLSVREPKAKQEDLDNRFTGSMLHKIIERFYKTLEVVGNPFSALSEERKSLGAAVLIEIFEEEWKLIEASNDDISPYDLDIEKTLWTNRLKKWWLAERELFWDNEKLKDMKLHSLEESVQLALEIDSETTLKLNGKIDRIDIDANGFAIYDYKSGSASLNIQKEVVPGLKLQLPLYMLSVQNKTGLCAHGASYVSLKEPKKRATNGVWRVEHAGKGSIFDVSSRTNKEEDLDGDSFLNRYNLKKRIKELWANSGFDYSVKPLKYYSSCPYNGICRVTDELKEEGEGNTNGF
ncbi:PD-(D/E)XK nuclease family protein [Alkalicella caledoniensis]|uniref:PD-(D/E)XK nuclease family protein n=1 Tax=Alkalicella caledoniensis TaxID=2731377 RepID=A0A7G9WBF1_ALKCA|nr:PD-(D/E)XK nuclease family protein [Alkalicella caledoniensis]QNO16013.1 PD-(D/E)XK nuclease family protein [Alkalicella caledoniensis]